MCLVRDEQHTIMEMVVEPTDDMFLALSLEQMSPGHLFKAPRQRSLSGAFSPISTNATLACFAGVCTDQASHRMT
jgi:hypothetical protein